MSAATFEPIVGAERCPFVRAVNEERFDDAKRIALAGPEPADESVLPLLMQWATEVVA